MSKSILNYWFLDFKPDEVVFIKSEKPPLILQKIIFKTTFDVEKKWAYHDEDFTKILKGEVYYISPRYKKMLIKHINKDYNLNIDCNKKNLEINIGDGTKYIFIESINKHGCDLIAHRQQAQCYYSLRKYYSHDYDDNFRNNYSIKDFMYFFCNDINKSIAFLSLANDWDSVIKQILSIQRNELP